MKKTYNEIKNEILKNENKINQFDPNTDIAGLLIFNVLKVLTTIPEGKLYDVVFSNIETNETWKTYFSVIESELNIK